MAESENKVKEYIEKYYLVVKKQYPVKKIFLFGSYAVGNPSPDSDIDIGVVIENLEQMDEIQVMRDLFKSSIKVSTLLEPYCISWNDYQNPQSGSIMYEIVKNGKTIIQA